MAVAQQTWYICAPAVTAKNLTTMKAIIAKRTEQVHQVEQVDRCEEAIRVELVKRWLDNNAITVPPTIISALAIYEDMETGKIQLFWPDSDVPLRPRQWFVG